MKEIECSKPREEEGHRGSHRITLIDWSTEDRPTFGYPDDRVEKLLYLTRDSLAQALKSIEEEGWYPNISPATRESFERSFELRRKALGKWIPKGSQALAEEARRLVEIARKIDMSEDTTHFSLGEKLKRFLKECGGEDHFHEVHEAVSCGGCLHRIAQLIFAGYHKKEE